MVNTCHSGEWHDDKKYGNVLGAGNENARFKGFAKDQNADMYESEVDFFHGTSTEPWPELNHSYDPVDTDIKTPKSKPRMRPMQLRAQ